MSTPGMSLEQLLAEMEAARPVVVRRVAARHRNPQQGDEQAQNGLTAAWEVWKQDPGYFLRHDLLSWVTQRAEWRLRDRRAELGRHVPLADEYGGDECVKSPEAVAAPTPDVEREQVWVMVHEAVAELPEGDRAIVEGYYFGGLTDKQLGAQLLPPSGRSVAALGLAVHRRRRKAQEEVGELLLERGYDPAAAGQAP